MPTDMEARFARTAGRLKLIDAARLERDIAATEAIRERGVYADLRTLLIGRRRMTHEDAERVLAEMGSLALHCAVCNNRVETPAYKPPHRCPQDNSPLKPTLAPDALPRPATKQETTRRMRPPEQAREGEMRDPLIGKMVGNYRVDELFDEEDAYCKTYIAALPRSGDPMMLKVLRSKDAVAQKRFLRGARYASLIHHPCVVPIV
ncbi:MAG: hypothetical protein AB7S36_13860, partial [Planctomycetota bacterium]